MFDRPAIPRDGCDRDRGQVAPLVAVFLVALLLVCGFVIDLGDAYRVQLALQASADAAATAGADHLPDATAAADAVNTYSSGPGGRNPVAGIGPVNVTADVNCASSARFCDPANTVQVTESADVPTTFLQLIGIGSIHETVHAQACSPCGAVPLDVMIVLDRTGSMAGQKLTDAREGILAFLGSMDPTIDDVGLVVLPPAANPADPCAASTSSAYDSPSADYLLVPLSGAYASSAGQLVPGSPLVSTVNCVRAGGGTAYASALDAAQQELDRDGRPGVQQVIIILSDGAANTGPGYLPPTSQYRTNPCGQAISSADASRAAGVVVYSIAYDISGSGADPCYADPGSVVNGVTVTNSTTPEQPRIQSYQALEAIASSGNYYAQPQPAQLTGIFLAISADITAGTSRLNG
jgi:hypothetical protein